MRALGVGFWLVTMGGMLYLFACGLAALARSGDCAQEEERGWRAGRDRLDVRARESGL